MNAGESRCGRTGVPLARAAAYPSYSGAARQSRHPAGEGRSLDEAEKTLRGRSSARPNAAALNQLGIVYRKHGRFKEADEAYSERCRSIPNYAIAYLNLGVLCDLYLQQPQRALEAFERYLALAPTPDRR